MGILFTYFAVDSAEDGIWDVTTMLFIMIATFDFGTAIRSLLKKPPDHKREVYSFP
jgi:hypothetical protein